MADVAGEKDSVHSQSPEWKKPERRGDAVRDRNRGGRHGGKGGRGYEKVRLHVGNIPFDMRWKELKDLVRDKVGDEVGFVELYEDSDGRLSGSGVVEMKGRELADKTIKLLNRLEVKGRRIIVRDEEPGDRPKPRDRSQQMSRIDGHDSRSSGIASLMDPGLTMGGGSFNYQFLSQIGIDIANITNQVFVANLDYKVTVMKMEEVFKIAGNVIEVDLKVDKDGRSRGIATVRYEHPMEAVQAICLLNGQYLFDREIGVRMDRWVDPILQDIPRHLPTGLRGLGIGLGAGGQPVLNIGQIANTLTLSMLSGQLTPASTVMPTTNLLAGGLNMPSALGMASSLGGGSGGLSQPSADVTSLLSTISSQLSALGGARVLGGGGLDSAGGLASLMGGDLGGNFDSGSFMNPLGSGDILDGRGGRGRRSSFDSSSAILRMGYKDGGNGGGGRGRKRSLEYDDDDEDYRRNMFTSSNNGGGTMENKSVFVKNLPFSCTWQRLVEEFRDCGDIKYAEIMSDKGRSRGCGIVEFHEADSAHRAITVMNGARIDGRQVEVRLDRLG